MENQDYLSELEIIFIVLGAIGVVWGIVALKHICLKWEMCPCEKCVHKMLLHNSCMYVMMDKDWFGVIKK